MCGVWDKENMFHGKNVKISACWEMVGGSHIIEDL